MPKKKGVRVTILVEDRALERFSREVLLGFGFSRRELRVVQYPVGRGSAKDWVDRKYPIQMQILRSKAYQNLAIVVGTDADEQTVAQRKTRLANALKADGNAARKDDEQVCLWIPKWNVETWFLHFAGNPRDEDTDHQDDVQKPDYKQIAGAFIDEYRRHTNGEKLHTLPSLRSAYVETERLNV